MSKETQSGTPGFEVFREQVNIGLFNDIIAFAAAAAAEDASPAITELSKSHIWYSRTFGNNIQDKYGFRYLGELLERFEEKAGPAVKDTRAIALALAYAKSICTDDMFVGNQKINFIRKITRLSAGDVYLRGALYLLKRGGPGAEDMLKNLTNAPYGKTEELIFALSLYDDFEEGFLDFKPRLITLLGAGRTMTAFGNVKIYYWLIKRLCSCRNIKEMRAKDMPLFRALMELPASFVKAGSRYHGVLLDSGYTAEEILYLNSVMVRLRPAANTMESHSITAEKIAVETCRTFINSGNAHEPDVYEHLEWLLKQYNSFEIKINGWQGIYKALENDIRIVEPRTFLWLFGLIEPKNIFRFNILEEKWDVLSRELEPDVYRNLFDRQMENAANLERAQITERIQKYGALTGLPYLAVFEQAYHYDKETVFALMVKKGVINLETAFSSCPGIDAVMVSGKDSSKPPMLLYIRKFIRGIHSREAFEFHRYFLQKYGFDGMHALFTDGPEDRRWQGSYDYCFFEELYNKPEIYHRNSGATIKIKRPFLSDGEHRKLLGWLDDYIYQYKTERYVEFSAHMLTDPFVSALFPPNELRGVYDLIRNTYANNRQFDNDALKQRFLAEEEIQAEREAEEVRKQEIKRQEREQTIRQLKEELAACYNGTFTSLLNYLGKHRFGAHYKEDDEARVAAGCLETALKDNQYTLNRAELGCFLQFCGKLVKDGAIAFAYVNELILKVKEAAENAENNGTSGTDSRA